MRSSAVAAAASLSDRFSTSGGRLADIHELTWEEREAILRLLLAHVNAKPTVKAAQEVFAQIEVAGYANEFLEDESVPEFGSPVITTLQREQNQSD